MAVPKSKEDKQMSNKTKKVATQETVNVQEVATVTRKRAIAKAKQEEVKEMKAQEIKVEEKVEAQVEEKVEEKQEVKNEAKVNAAISMADVVKLYQELNIACKNPNAKGNYRIMRGGSSLNVTRKAYNIYSTDADLELVKEAKLEGVEVEAGANAQDKTRPHTIRCTTVEVLKALLAVYAKNPDNITPVVAQETAVAK
jgi:hypothetical protein